MNKVLFMKTISGIWSNIFKKTYAPITEKIDKKTFLDGLFCEIETFTYAPSNPREYVVSNKHNLVSRIVPVLSIKDICVYYFCVKSLEDKLAVDRVDGTYGGFSMGGSIRKKEEDEFNSLSEIPFSVSPYTYNPFAWVKAWRDFQKKAYTYSAQDEYSYFIKIDVANFYDCINLNLLEKKLEELAIRGIQRLLICFFNFYETGIKNLINIFQNQLDFRKMK